MEYLIAQCLDLIKYFGGGSGAVILDAALDDLTELTLADLEGIDLIDQTDCSRVGSVNIAQILGNVSH